MFVRLELYTLANHPMKTSNFQDESSHQLAVPQRFSRRFVHIRTGGTLVDILLFIVTAMHDARRDLRYLDAQMHTVGSSHCSSLIGCEKIWRPLMEKH